MPSIIFRSCGIKLVILLFPAAIMASDLANWAEIFYADSTKFCSIATIETVEPRINSVIVSIGAESQTREALARLDKSARDDWIALHCPAATNTIWRNSDEGFDVHINTVLGSGDPYTLSCQNYHSQASANMRQKREGVLERLTKLLGRTPELSPE